MRRGYFPAVFCLFVGWAKARLRRAHHLSKSVVLIGGHAALCPAYELSS